MYEFLNSTLIPLPYNKAMPYKISVQLYPYRFFDEDNLTSLLKQIASSSCQSVEITSENIERCPNLVDLINLNNLSISGIHVGLDEVEKIQIKTRKILRCVVLENQMRFPYRLFKPFLKTMGRKIDFKGKTNYHQTKFWESLGKRISKFDELKLHSHSFEHLPIADNERPWEILNKTLPSQIKFQLDLENFPTETSDYYLDNQNIKNRISSIHLDLDHFSKYSREKKLDILNKLHLSEVVIEQRKIDIEKLIQQIYDLNSVTKP